jgi:hypothetical protein
VILGQEIIYTFAIFISKNMDYKNRMIGCVVLGAIAGYILGNVNNARFEPVVFVFSVAH